MKVAKIAIIGGGLTGLVAAYRLVQKGHKVTVFERGESLGGLMGGFKIGDTYLEKTYHHIFRKDREIIRLIEELGLIDKLKWYQDKTAMVYDKKIYSFASAVDLLRFKPLGLVDKLRLGLVKIYLEKENNWKKFEKITAVEWMKTWCGKRAFEVVWEPLVHGKFGQYADQISMAWLWARVHSRGSGGLGYLAGGFQQIVDELAKRIKEKGGTIKLNYAIPAGGQLSITNYELKKFDRVMYTGPIQGIKYIGAVCLVFTSKQNLSPYYWHNINESDSPFLAFIQHTNLVDRSMYDGKHVYYLGTYGNHEQSVDGWFDYLKKMFPNFDKNLVEEKFVFRFKTAQHIVTCEYQIPSYKVNENLYQVSFAQIYPEDRGMNFAVREGDKAANFR